MILIYAPYPDPGTVHDGWMGRIQVIDRIFKDRPRFYVFPGNPLYSQDPKDYRTGPVQVEEQAWMWWMDLRFSLHWRKLTELVDQCDFVYAHTCHSPQVLHGYYRTGKVITDIHGIAPEEEVLQGKPNQAEFFGALEESMARESAALVTVTEAMASHYRAKYPGLTTRMIQLPIVDQSFPDANLTRPRRERLQVVYAGGTQSWQNVDLMFEIVASCHQTHDFSFYSNDPAAMAEAARRHGVEGKVAIDRCAMDQLPEIYGKADLGFVLRDDIAVNRVACPTKLSEYLATGVIPVVKLAEIGDFAEHGYEFVTADDLLAGKPMDPDRWNAARAKNRAVFDAIGAEHEAGKRTLRELPNPEPRLDMARQRSLFLTPMERTMVLPLRGAELRYTRGGVVHAKPLHDLAFPDTEFEFELAGEGPVTSLDFFPMERPFVVTPVVVDLLTSDGGEHRVALRGNYRHDAYGNWLFDRGRPVVSGRKLGIEGARAVRIRFEFLLYGPETGVAKRSRVGRLLCGGASRSS